MSLFFLNDPLKRTGLWFVLLFVQFPHSSAGFDHQFFFKRQDLSSYRVKHSKRNSIFTHVHVLFSIYDINCGVSQGFLALKKAVAAHVKKHRIFSRVLIFNQLHTRHSPLAPLGQVDEWTANFSRLVVCRSFLELWRRKNKKFRIVDRQRGSNFPRR